MEISSRHIESITQTLRDRGVSSITEKNRVVFTYKNKSVIFIISPEEKSDDPENLDFHSENGDKITGLVLSRLGLNRRIFARECTYEAIDKKTAEIFLDKHHLLNSTGSAYNRGLLFKNELLAVASFSKGRKMTRLNEAERSFELIRFCCAYGISVSGGLSKLVKNFCREKNAGDIMSYVDTRLSDGESFTKAGFGKEKSIFVDTPEKKYHENSIKMLYSCKQ